VAESGELSSTASDPEARASGSPPPAADVWREEGAPARATVYWVLLGLLVVGPFVVRGDARLAWPPSVYLAVEAVATTLALVLGALALVRYLTGRRRTYLYIGAGFLASGVLDTTEATLALAAGAGDAFVLGTAWSWFGSRGLLALFLAVSAFAARGERPGAGERDAGALSVLGLAAAFTALTVVFLVLVRRQGLEAIHPAWVYPRPQELLPGILFLAAFLGYLRRGRWRVDGFEHWLVVTLLISAMTHLAYMGLSRAEGDALHAAAHLLEVASYLALLSGVIASVYHTSRREQGALAAIRRINEDLGRQVRIRGEAERVLQRSEERLQSFLDNAHDLIQSSDAEGRLAYVNAAWCAALGHAPEEVEGRPLTELVAPEERARVSDILDRVLEGERLGPVELPLLGADGRSVICSGSLARYVADDGTTSVQGIFRDVSSQRRAELDLASSQANLEAVVESTGDAIWSVDREQRLVTMNSAFALAFEAQTGREPRPGDGPADVFPPDDVAWYRELHHRALSGERFSELREETVGGEARFFEIFGQPVQGMGGVSGAVMFGRDVTRRIMAEEGLRMAKEEAEAANRAKSQFLANMSHELRTPLNSVIGFANVLLKNRRGNLEPQDTGFLERILVNGRHLLALIDQVLDLAKVESGRMELDLVACDVGALARETVQQLEGQAREKRVELTWDVPEAPVVVQTDVAKLRQVLINLVGNALKFSEGGRVTVRLDTDDRGRPAGLAVIDTGIGIPEDRLQAIFEAFQQADASTARRFGGTGLGLAISRSICLLLGYDLTVESEVGEGSTFTILMGAAARPEDTTPVPETAVDPTPAQAAGRGEGVDRTAALEAAGEGRTAPSVEAGLPAPASVPPVRGVLPGAVRDLRVLVIDDEEDARVLLSHFLGEFGCSVAVTTSAREGLESARRHPPDLITLDLVMPEMDGWEALRTLKEDPKLRDIPVVVVSMVADQDRSRLLGAVDLLRKPIDREDLLRVLWRHLVRRRGGRVLVVEDDNDTRALLREYLEGAGLEVTSAENGRDALYVVNRESPDAILLDLGMPVMDGLDFLRNLRENPYTSGTPVVVVTAMDLDAEEEEFLSETVSAVIPKGDDIEVELRRVLGTILPLAEA